MSALAEPLRRGLPLAFWAYVAAVVLMHLSLPQAWVWHIAFVALIGMLFTYPAHAAVQGDKLRLEMSVSWGFALVGLLGLLLTPLLLIAAIAGHGLLDLAKYRGLGAEVPVWYLLSCAVFDLAYAAYLLGHL
ncbi:MAG: hypothetical protein AAF744_01875 [Pseudomonadota bacterium]